MGGEKSCIVVYGSAQFFECEVHGPSATAIYHLSIILNTHVECSNRDFYVYSGLLPEVLDKNETICNHGEKPGINLDICSGGAAL